MDQAPVSDTRGRILRAALDLFAARGYQRTSLRAIADQLRLTKAAILYHFPSKEDLLVALVEPLLSDLESALDAADGLPGPAARWVVIEGWLDVLLAHRHSLGLLYHDLTLFSRGSTYARMLRIAMRANELVAGPGATRLEQIRAVQVVAAISDPVVFFIDVPADQVRADMLDGVRRLLREPPPADPAAPEHGGPVGRSGPDPDGATAAAGAARTGRRPEGADGPAPHRPRRAGRPRALSREQISAARAMHAAGAHTVAEIAARLGVSRATVYRQLRSTEPPPHDNETGFETNSRLI